MTDLTFDHLPKAVAEIKAKMDTIEQLLHEILGKGGTTSIQNEYVNIDEAAKILTLSKGFIYKLTCKMEIPHYKRGKRLYFSIVTTEVNSVMAMIHNSKKRMPLILDEIGWRRWIDPKTTKEEIQGLMKGGGTG